MLWQPGEPPADMVADIRSRLGRICGSYSAEEFTVLVRQIAAVRVKYDALRAETFYEAVRVIAAERMATRNVTDRSLSRLAQP